MTRRRSYSIPFPPSISAVIDDNLKRLKKSSFPLQQKKRNVAGSPPSVCPSRISWRRPGISQPEGRKRRPKEKTSETQRERKTYLNLDTRKRKERRSCTVNLANKSRPRAR